MTTYVLVHGAWHGGWCWREVAAVLRGAGHDVYAPTLSGLGERVHLARWPIDLQTHIQDVANVLRFEELADIRLVGHSYGGVVISGVAEMMHEKIGHLVYLDAIVPKDGKRQIDMVPRRAGGSAEQFDKTEGEARELPVGSMAFLGVKDTEQVERLNRLLVPHPMATLLEPSRLPEDRASKLPRTFIYCLQRETPSQFALDAKGDPSWRYREIDTGHDAMITAPDRLAELLLEVA